MRRLLCILSAMLAATPLLLGGAAALAPVRVLVNLQMAENLGCSDDMEPALFFGSYPAPDFQARVWHEGRGVATTRHIRDNAHIEWLELAEFEVSSLPATVSIEVREAEPGPAPQTPTWVTCDVSSGPGSWLNVSVPLQSATDFEGRGEDGLAARVVGRAGPERLPHPVPLRMHARDPPPGCLSLEWTPPADEPPGVLQTMQDGRHSERLPPETTSYEGCGRHPGWRYDMRLLRELEGWRVAHPPELFVAGAEARSTAPPPREAPRSPRRRPPRPPPRSPSPSRPSRATTR